MISDPEQLGEWHEQSRKGILFVRSLTGTFVPEDGQPVQVAFSRARPESRGLLYSITRDGECQITYGVESDEGEVLHSTSRPLEQIRELNPHLEFIGLPNPVVRTIARVGAVMKRLLGRKN
jgi:hypothetical protein